jgi:hypothetical protein
VMDPHRFLVDVRLERVVGVRQVGHGERHRNSFSRFEIRVGA